LSGVYLSIAGASFALNALLKFVAKFTGIGYLLSSYYIIALSLDLHLSRLSDTYIE
jgi:hypothetical protein